MIKRIFLLILAVVFAASLVSCSNGGGVIIPYPSQTVPITDEVSTSPLTSIFLEGTDTFVPPLSQTPDITPNTTPDTTPNTTPDETSVQVGVIIPASPSSAYKNANIKSDNAFVYDVEKGLLYSKGDLTAKIYPASVTKLYTAYVALKYLSPETVVTAGDELSMRAPDSSVAYISRGQKLTVSMLVEAMMLPSGNDAAYVLATAAGRALRHDPNCSAEEAVKTFMYAVNRNGEMDGFVNTHFSTPDGYHSDDHYTCLNDLIIIAQLALKNETIMKYTGLYKEKVYFVSGESITWTNNNPLVNPYSEYYRKNVIGLKTGFTSKAGSCIIAAQKKGDSIVLVGIFGASSSARRNSDAVTLLDIAAKNQK